MPLKEKQLAFQILTPCTLKCKLCADYSPLYMKKKDYYYVTFENFKKEVSTTFAIYDYIENITITGGEPLMHPQLSDFVQYIFENYASQFSTCRIFTNGTIIPSKKLIETIQRCSDNNFQFVVDCYGDISSKTHDIQSLLNANAISCRINNYYGTTQYCGGWIDYGPLSEYRNYSPEKVQQLFSNCHNNKNNLMVFKGKLCICTQAIFGFDLGYFTLNPNEYIDLFDSNVSIETKKEQAASLHLVPLSACQYCNGFDAENSQRYPAGEQLADE